MAISWALASDQGRWTRQDPHLPERAPALVQQVEKGRSREVTGRTHQRRPWRVHRPRGRRTDTPGWSCGHAEMPGNRGDLPALRAGAVITFASKLPRLLGIGVGRDPRDLQPENQTATRRIPSSRICCSLHRLARQPPWMWSFGRTGTPSSSLSTAISTSRWSALSFATSLRSSSRPTRASTSTSAMCSERTVRSKSPRAGVPSSPRSEVSFSE